MWNRQYWLGRHASAEFQYRPFVWCLSLGINFESELIWFNVGPFNSCFMWNVQPGKVGAAA